MFGLCSGFSNVPQPGQYALETFRKVPAVGGLLGNLSSLVGGGGFSGLTNLVGNFTGIGSGGQQGQQGQQPQGINNLIANWGNSWNNQPAQNNQVINIPPAFDPSNFQNNIPLDSIKSNDNNFNELINSGQPGQVVKKILKSNYTDLLKQQRQKGGKWTDPDFPPNQTSIGTVDDVPIKTSWKRIPDIIKKPEFVSGKIEPADILQGSLGDCYFLSAIAALAENDFRIKNLFPDLDLHPEGIYMARILHGGVLKQVVVDDYIPVNSRGQPYFAKPAGGNQVWVMILEKCWAKLHGSYGAIVAGLPNEVLHAFSGAPTFYNNVPEDQQGQYALWNKMWAAHSKGGILCCGTKGEDSIEKYGFVKGHAYTLLSIFEQPYRIVKLRNPWGSKQWSGRCSDSDTAFWSRITPADKQKMGYSNHNDGVFFMLWEDFVNYFDMVDICKINDNANFVNADAVFDRSNGQMFEFQTRNKTNVTVSLSQPSLRGASEAVEAKGYARSVLIVARHDNSATGYEYKYVDSCSDKNFSQTYLQLPALEAGKYVVFAKIDWITQTKDNSSVSVYADTATLLVNSKQSKHDEFLHKVFLDHARNNPKKQVLNKSPSEWICSDFLLQKSGYGYLAFHIDEKSTRKIGVQLKESDYTDRRLILKKPYKGKGVIKTTVEPGKQLIVLYRMKSTNFPNTITLPTPKIYNLI